MPKIRSEKLVTASVSLPQETWDDLKEIGLMMGLREAEMYRRAITLGIIAMKTELKAILDYDNAVVDHDNKVLLNKKLKQRQADMQSLLYQFQQEVQFDSEGTKWADLVKELTRLLTD